MLGVHGDTAQELHYLGQENDRLQESIDELLMVIIELDADENCPMCSKSCKVEQHDSYCRIHNIAKNYGGKK